MRRRVELSSTYADDFVGHKRAAANKYRRPKTQLERRSVGEADRVGEGMVIAVNSLCRVWMEITLTRAEILFRFAWFRELYVREHDRMKTNTELDG